MRVLVTRAQDDAARTAARLAALGHEAVIAPLTVIAPTGHAIPDEVFDAVLATSVHALAFVKALPPALSGAPWLVVGDRLGDALAPPTRAIDAVLHYSRRSAERFVVVAGNAGRMRHIAISADAAAPLLAQGWRVEIAASPDEDAMLGLLA